MSEKVVKSQDLSPIAGRRAGWCVLWNRETGGHVVTSCMKVSDVRETLCFNASPDGVILGDFDEIGRSVADDHEGALRDAGFEVVESFEAVA